MKDDPFFVSVSFFSAMPVVSLIPKSSFWCQGISRCFSLLYRHCSLCSSWRPSEFLVLMLPTRGILLNKYWICPPGTLFPVLYDYYSTQCFCWQDLEILDVRPTRSTSRISTTAAKAVRSIFGGVARFHSCEMCESERNVWSEISLLRNVWKWFHSCEMFESEFRAHTKVRPWYLGIQGKTLDTFLQHVEWIIKHIRIRIRLKAI